MLNWAQNFVTNLQLAAFMAGPDQSYKAGHASRGTAARKRHRYVVPERGRYGRLNTKRIQAPLG